MIVEIKVPPIGESITEGLIAEWLKGDGDIIAEEEDLFELETDKVTMAISATASGQLSIIVKEGEMVEIGQVVGKINTDIKPNSQSPSEIGNNSSEVSSVAAPPITAPAGMEQLREKTIAGYDVGGLSPAVRRMISELNIDPKGIEGSGKDGRIIKADLINLPEKKNAISEPAEQRLKIKNTDRQTRKPISMLRQRIAERLVLSQQEAAILTTFNEIDMTNLMAMRTRNRAEFEKKHGIKLGIMSFFVKSAIEALKAIPQVGAQIDGNELIYNNFFDIGVAVSTERGLIVPVIREADKMSFSQVEVTIADFSRRANERKITLEDLTGGVFTISNGGVFGSLMSTPILNPPQSAILGLHGIKKRPVAVGEDDHIEVRPMMYVALSYDHRVIDGAEAVTFLKKIVSCIENPERIMFEI